MGQRLVVNIREGEDIKCNAYYHWSGYTNSAIAIIKEMKLDEFEERYGHMKPIIAGINMLLSTGASFGQNRNYGLIEVDEQGIKGNLRWSEMTVDVDLKSKTVDFYECFSTYMEDDEDDSEESKIPVEERCIDKFDSWVVDFANITEFADKILNGMSNYKYNRMPLFYVVKTGDYVEPSVW